MKQVLTAFGDEASPIAVFDREKGTTQTASELEWNTKTDQFRIKGLRGRIQP
jgi:hypothetical protein